VSICTRTPTFWTLCEHTYIRGDHDFKLHTQSHILHFKLLKACSPHIAHREYGECRSIAGLLSDPGQDHRQIEMLVRLKFYRNRNLKIPEVFEVWIPEVLEV